MKDVVASEYGAYIHDYSSWSAVHEVGHRRFMTNMFVMYETRMFCCPLIEADWRFLSSLGWMAAAL